jgi:tetratricopeptide (TPR) repeat protein
MEMRVNDGCQIAYHFPMETAAARPPGTHQRATGLGLLVRGLLSLLLVACLVEVAREALAVRSAKNNSLAGLYSARRWDPSNPTYPVQLALSLTENSLSSNPREVIGLLEEAARLGPRRADTWASLGGGLESVGKVSNAVGAYERALEFFPKSPEINWEFANLLIRAGEESKALAPLRQAILGDPSLRTGAFDLVWRAGIPPDQILGIIPVRQEILSAYLDYLVQTHRLDAAASVWGRLLASPESFDLDAAFRYFDALFHDHRVDSLATVWAGLLRHEPARIHWQPGNANLITNGGFEDPPVNGGFDWRTPGIEGADIRIDESVVHSGTRSLLLHFEGTRNLDFGHVAQYVSVNPDTSYRFLAYARAEGITTNSGPRIAIYDAFDRKALSLETENLLGSTDWREQQLAFHTGPQTNLIVVQVVRPPSRKIDNRIAGTLWLDDFSLTVVR